MLVIIEKPKKYGSRENVLIKVPVESLEEASFVFCETRDIHQFGSSNYQFKESGDVVDENGNFIAWVSYNGRTWKGRNYELPSEQWKEIILDESKRFIGTDYWRFIR